MGPLFRAGFTLEQVLDHTLPQLQWMGFCLHLAEVRWWERIFPPSSEGEEGEGRRRPPSPSRPGPRPSSSANVFRAQRPPGLSEQEWEVEKDLQRAHFLRQAGIGVTITRGGEPAGG